MVRSFENLIQIIVKPNLFVFDAERTGRVIKKMKKKQQIPKSTSQSNLKSIESEDFRGSPSSSARSMSVSMNEKNAWNFGLIHPNNCVIMLNYIFDVLVMMDCVWKQLGSRYCFRCKRQTSKEQNIKFELQLYKVIVQ